MLIRAKFGIHDPQTSTITFVDIFENTIFAKIDLIETHFIPLLSLFSKTKIKVYQPKLIIDNVQTLALGNDNTEEVAKI